MSSSTGSGRYEADPKYAKLRDQTQRDFQAGKLDLLVAQIRTGGVGLDLFRGKRGVIYSCTFSWIDYDQALARMDKIGEEQVEIYHLIARETVDEDIFTALTSKRSVTEAVLDRLKRRSSS